MFSIPLMLLYLLAGYALGIAIAAIIFCAMRKFHFGLYAHMRNKS